MSTKKTRPSKALLRDLKYLFDKHQWRGTAFGITAPETVPADLNCEPPKKPTLVTIVREDGTKFTTTVCL